MYKSSLASFVRLFKACLTEGQGSNGTSDASCSASPFRKGSTTSSEVEDRLGKLTPALEVRLMRRASPHVRPHVPCFGHQGTVFTPTFLGVEDSYVGHCGPGVWDTLSPSPETKRIRNSEPRGRVFHMLPSIVHSRRISGVVFLASSVWSHFHAVGKDYRYIRAGFEGLVEPLIGSWLCGRFVLFFPE